VLQWRRELLKYAQNQQNDIQISSPSHSPSPMIVKTVEIYVTSEPAQVSTPARLLGFESRQTSISMPPSTYYDRNPSVSLPSIDANRAAISYCKCALLFFAAMLVTWVPSTINRLVTLVHPHDPIFALNYVAALVLPLQGFWNATIYIFTSLPACKAFMRKTTTALHIDQIPLGRNGRFSMTSDSNGSHGREGNKQQADRSDSVRELHPEVV
jgi:hypothetical protein